MHFKILCVLLLLKCLKIVARGRIPIAKNTEFPPRLNSTTENLNLPGGFNPLPPPIQPLLYPFATEQPPGKKSNTTPGWKPIVANQAMARSTSFLTQIPQSFPTSTESHEEFEAAPPPPSFKETVVYGSWKPEPPLQPAILEGKNEKNSTEKSKENTRPLQNTVRRRLGGFLGEVERKKYFDDSLEASMSTESFEQSKTAIPKSLKKQGRRKIPTSNEKKNYDPVLKSRIINSMPVIRVNASDPELLKIAKQINESIEATTQKQKPKNQTNSTSVEQNTTNQNLQISKEWPTDFGTSNEKNSKVQDNSASVQENFYHFLGDSSEPPQALAGINFDDVLPSPTSYNITKMGIPYENQNSGEDPSICVPLSVRERSASNENEIIEVERVYCFPLPSPDTKSINSNETLTLDKDAQFSVLSYDELITSGGMRHVCNMLWFISLNLLFI